MTDKKLLERADYLANLAVDNGEGGAQIEIKDRLLRDSLVLNVKTQMIRAMGEVAAKPPALAPVRQEPGGDGSVRKAHYGSGKQPWDTTLEKGWGPHAAAFCVIRYLRRDKAIEHSRESARWYYNQLLTRAADEEAKRAGVLVGPWLSALRDLNFELTQEEKEILTCSPS